MASGGKRPGAGRKKNTPNKANALREARIAASGVTPLDVMIQDMRFHYDLYQEAMANRDLAVAKAELKEARDAAKDAAPYTHPRLAAVEHMGKGGGPIEYSDAKAKLAHLQSRVAVAGGNGGSSGRAD